MARVLQVAEGPLILARDLNTVLSPDMDRLHVKSLVREAQEPVCLPSETNLIPPCPPFPLSPLPPHPQTLGLLTSWS